MKTSPSALKLRKPLTAGTWNVRTLWKTGAARLLVEQLSRARINLMGLQEVRWHDSGELRIDNYTLLWSGPPTGSPRCAGVALAMDQLAARSLISWHPINPRLLSAVFQHSLGLLQVIVAYAPTEEASQYDKDTFYQDLDSVYQNLRPTQATVILGDFNAVSGTDRNCYCKVLGPHGSGTSNDNTERLLNFCSGAGLRVAGSWFQRKNIHRLSWFSNDGVTAKEIDHVLANTRWSILRNCRVYRSLEFDTDHLPVVSTLVIRLKRLSRKKNAANPKYNLEALEDRATRHQFELEIQNRFSVLSDTECMDDWETLRDSIQEVAADVVGLKANSKHDWVSNTTRDLINKKRDARLRKDMLLYKTLTKECRVQVRNDRQLWADTLALEGESKLKDNQLHDAFSNFRKLRPANFNISSPITTSDGSLVSDKQGKLVRWQEYYETLLNRPPVPPPVTLRETASTAVTNHSIPVHPPTIPEVNRAITRLSLHRAPGICGISAELLKAGGVCCTQWLTQVICKAWETGCAPDDWKRGIILPFYKGKGSRTDCRNYRGITLLSVPGKVYAHVLLARVKGHLQQLRRTEQSGFTPHRSTVDRITTLNMILQTRREYRRPSWVAYVDFRSAFDSIDRQSLWLLLRSKGIPDKILELLEDLYSNTLSCIRVDGELSPWFKVSAGVRQGCVLAPDLFLEPMDWVMDRTVHRGYLGLNVGNETFTDLDFADDVSLLASMLEIVVLALEILHEESSQLGLEINWSKTKIQVFDEDISQPSKVSVLGHDVEVVDSFVYLGSCIDIAGGSETDISRRIEMTRTCMKALDRNLWRSSISLRTKIRLYNVYILPILLYGADTWSMTSTSSRRIDAFDQWCLRHILRIPYTAHVTNDEVRRRTCQPPATHLITTRRLRLFGHIARAGPSQDHSRALRAAISRLPADWRRPPGRPRRTWLRTIELDLQHHNLGLNSAWKRAQDRSKWRRLVETAMSCQGRATR